MRRSRFAFMRRLLLASATVSSAACTSTRVERGPVHESLPSSGRNGEVRLSLKNGEQIQMYRPVIEGDSVIGSSAPESNDPQFRVAVAKGDILSVAVRKGNAFKTVLAVTAGVYGAVLLIALVACATYASSV